jgi:hypothetical protein
VKADEFLVKVTTVYGPVPPVTLIVNWPVAKFGVFKHGRTTFVNVTTGVVCAKEALNETTVRAMITQLQILVKKDFGIILVFGDEVRALF